MIIHIGETKKNKKPIRVRSVNVLYYVYVCIIIDASLYAVNTHVHDVRKYASNEICIMHAYVGLWVSNMFHVKFPFWNTSNLKFLPFLNSYWRINYLSLIINQGMEPKWKEPALYRIGTFKTFGTRTSKITFYAVELQLLNPKKPVF